MTDPWRRGTDPVQRLLRAVTVVVCLAVFAYLSVSPDSGADQLPSVFLAVGCLLVLLGYEGVVRLPFIGRKDDDDDA